MAHLAKYLLPLTLFFLISCSTQETRESAEQEFTIEELKQRAQVSSEAGSYSDALLNHRRILEKEPENIDSLIATGEIMLATGKAERAKVYFVRALGVKPNNVAAREGRALSWLMLGQYADARKSFLSLVDEGVESWRVWNGLGIIADLFADYEKSESYYRRAIALSPDRVLLQNNLGYSLIMNKDYQGAESVLRVALKSAPANARIVNNLSMAIAWQGQYDEAISQLQLVMGAAEAHNNIGYVAYLAGDYTQAELLFRKAMQLKPSYYQRAAKNLELVLKKKQ